MSARQKKSSDVFKHVLKKGLVDLPSVQIFIYQDRISTHIFLLFFVSLHKQSYLLSLIGTLWFSSGEERPHGRGWGLGLLRSFVSWFL
ncbi:hypothetical protein CEXT_791951 [Caerostris extrusa]|uniref:Uncharacterized protein n=1 Tax=Caerostris extrusa TaxID=172846 RepID=A0AAV4V0L0_CAEEX|nr:hypothetical protein CEXT_791951 [Caerostris extrusa]